jgi:hypothetical protein
MNVASPPSGILDPKKPWHTGKVGDRVWEILKAKLTGGKTSDGTSYSSFVNLTNADADRLINNIKKYGKYPQINQPGGAEGYENLQKYQEWLVEEFLEKPFQQQTNQKIEDAAVESRLKEIQEQKKQKAQSFISKSTSSAQGNKVSAKTTTISSIVPKKTVPQEVAEKIVSPPTIDGGENETVASPSKKVVSSLGRLTLDLVQINDNLDKIKDVIAEDYNQTKEKNKKEIEDYRKRVANKGRKFSKKDLGNDKRSLKDIIKPFVGGFFSGVGGSIRSLAAFNLLDALVSGNPLKAFQSLMGIGITFIPQIGTMIAGAVLKSLLKGFGKGVVGGGMRGGPMRAPRGIGGGKGIGKFGSMMALGTGALALGGAYLASQQDETDPQATDGQTRLEQVTAEQKALTEKGLVSITQDDLKKFEELNKKFEKSIDLLLIKNGAGGGSGPGGGGSGTDASGSAISDAPVNMDTSLRGTVSGPQFNNSQLVDLAKKVGATDEEAVRLAAIAKYESGGRAGAHNDSYLRGGSDNSYGLWQINMKDSLGPARMKEFGLSSYDQLKDPVTNAQAALKVLRGSGWGAWTTNSKVTPGDLQEGRKNLQTKTPTPAPPPQPAAKPSPQPARKISSTAGSGPKVAIVPIPNLTGSNGPGSFNNNGSGDVASVDPRNPYDVYGRINRTGLNVVDVG